MQSRLIVVLAVLSLALSGCAMATYQAPDGTKVTYTRFFTTSDSIEAQTGNAKVKAGGQKIDLSTLQALLNLMAGAK